MARGYLTLGGRGSLACVLRLAVIFIIQSAPGFAAELPPPDLRLSPGDVLDISVFANENISKRYRIRDDGNISMHLAGPVRASGLHLQDFEKALNQRLAEVVQGPINATVEVSEWRPVAVLGDVTKPGLFPFLSGLDVRRAIAQAGGMVRIALDGSVTSAMRLSEEERRFHVIKGTLAGLLIEEARLLAERDRKKEVTLPPEVLALVSEPEARRIASEQTRLLASRDEILAIRTAGETDRGALAQQEADFFAKRRSLSQSQAEATREGLAEQEELRRRGLATSSRLLELSIGLDRFRSDELEAAAFEASALQKASDAASNVRQLTHNRDREISERLSAIGVQMLEVRAELTETRRFLQTFGSGDPLGDEASASQYTITRRIDGENYTFPATLSSLLQPGDALDVMQVLPETNTPPAIGTSETN